MKIIKIAAHVKKPNIEVGDEIIIFDNIGKVVGFQSSGDVTIVNFGFNPEARLLTKDLTLYKKRPKEISIFLVRRKDESSYDEFRAFVVKADSEEDAQKICYDYATNESTFESFHAFGNFSKENVTITKITAETPNGVILGDFHDS